MLEIRASKSGGAARPTSWTKAVAACALAALAAACQGEESIGSSEEHLFGDITYAADCTSDMEEFLDKAMFYGRVAAVSDVFEECIDESFRTGLARNGKRFGPYLACNGDPFEDEPIDTQVAKAIDVGRTLNDVTINCTGGGGIASTGQVDGYGHSNPETLAWGEWLSVRMATDCWRHDPMDCDATSPASPMDEAAQTVWHEASHTHGYGHGHNDNQEAAKAACGYPELTDTEWHFQLNTAPYMIDACIGYILARSGRTCRLTDCGPDALHIINDLDETGCSCIRDPALTGGPSAGPVGAELDVVRAAPVGGSLSQEVSFTVRNRGVAPALDVEVVMLGINSAGDTTDPSGAPWVIWTWSIASLDAGQELTFSHPLASISDLHGVEITVDPNDLVREADNSDNTRSLLFHRPDLRPTSIEARMGRQKLEGVVWVMNDGDWVAPPTELKVSLTSHASASIAIGTVSPHGRQRVPFVIPLPAPTFWGTSPSVIIGASDRVEATADANDDITEPEELDNTLQGEVVWPDLGVEHVTAPDYDAFFGTHNLVVGYEVANAFSAHANLFSHEVRLEDRTGAIIASSRVGPVELAPGTSLARTGVSLEFTDSEGSLTCNGHSYNEYWLRISADPQEYIAELREDNNEVGRRFVTTDDRPPVVAVADPGPLSFVVSSPDEVISFTVEANASDPDGDPLTLSWSSTDVALHGGTITPGPGPNQATVRMTARGLSALRCAVPGASTVVHINVTATADDCILEASNTRPIPVALELAGGPVPDELVCELAYRGLDELERVMLRWPMFPPFCPLVLDPQGSMGACTGLPWLEDLFRRWGGVPKHVLPPADLEVLDNLRTLVADLPKGLVHSWDRSLSLAELGKMLEDKQLSGGAMTALVLQQSIMSWVRPLFAPVPIARGDLGQAEVLGFRIDLGAAQASGPLGLVPTAESPAMPDGMSLLADAPVMAVITPGRLGNGALISYTASRGDLPLRLVAIGPKGATDITVSLSKDGRTVTGLFTGGAWGVAVAVAGEPKE